MVKLIQKFYEDFHHLDAESMAAAYHKDVIFSDPAFGILQGPSVVNMWRMLCASQNSNDFKVNLINCQIDGQTGTARWEAFYIFSKTGRPVHNIIDARFRFSEGLIIEHHDNFRLYEWSKQALGLPGYLLGWNIFFKHKLQRQTRAMLKSFESKQGTDLSDQ